MASPAAAAAAVAAAAAQYATQYSYVSIQKEDGTAVIATKLVRVTSLISSSLTTATPLAGFVTSNDGSTSTATATSIVAQPGVTDFFRFYTVTGTATITCQVCAL
jgi:hypothetical protein